MKKIFLMMLMAVVAVASYAQTKSEILATCETIINTPLEATTPQAVQQSSAILLAWLTSTSDCNIEVGSWAHLLMPEDPKSVNGGSMLLAFMAGEVKYMLEHNQKESNVESALAGMEIAEAYYKANRKFMPEFRGFDEYLKLDEAARREALAN